MLILTSFPKDIQRPGGRRYPVLLVVGEHRDVKEKKEKRNALEPDNMGKRHGKKAYPMGENESQFEFITTDFSRVASEVLGTRNQSLIRLFDMQKSKSEWGSPDSLYPSATPRFRWLLQARRSEEVSDPLVLSADVNTV